MLRQNAGARSRRQHALPSSPRPLPSQWLQCRWERDQRRRRAARGSGALPRSPPRALPAPPAPEPPPAAAPTPSPAAAVTVTEPARGHSQPYMLRAD
eukprot:1380587-Rhodomonas_salina.1